MKAHTPQDEVYGPMELPAYCWEIIDKKEFQRLRYIYQLGTSEYVYPCATHSRFEHSLGVAHLANLFMNHIKTSQPELEIKPEWHQAVVIAGLCHDLGHGPWSHRFEVIARKVCPSWEHEANSIILLNHIVEKYNLSLPKEVYDAAGKYIAGEEYEGYPQWLSTIIANHENDIDLDKYDYLARDMNRTFMNFSLDFRRLIKSCQVVGGKLAYRHSEVSTIERIFFNRNDMHRRVYQHRVNSSIGLMISDMLEAANTVLCLENILEDPEEFCKLDCRIMYAIERGKYGEDAKAIAGRIHSRDLYRCVGELRLNPSNTAGLSYSQKPAGSICEDIASFSGGAIEAADLRYEKMKYTYGITKTHPLLHVPFFRPGDAQPHFLQGSDISCIVPVNFVEIGMRIYVTSADKEKEALRAVDEWKKARSL